MNQLGRQISAFTAIRTVFNTMHRMVYPFLSTFARGVGVDIESMSYMLTMRSVIGTLGPFVASVADQRGRRFGMLLGVGMFTLGTVLVVFSPTFPALALALVLGTLGKYIFDPAMQAFLGDRVEYGRRGRVIAVTEFGWSLAFIAGVPLAGFLISRSGWMAPFPLLAVLGGLAMVAVMRLIPRDRPVDRGANPGGQFRRVLTHAPALAGLSIGMCVSAANETVNLIFGVWLEDSFGLQIAALGAAAAVIGLSELGGEGLVALFSDRLGKSRAIALGLALNSLAALALPWLGQSTFGALAGLLLFYLSFEFTIVSIIPMMTEVLPSARATLMAFNVAALSLGRALGAPLAPVLYGFGFPVVVIGAIGFNLLAFLGLARLWREPFSGGASREG